MRRSVLAVTCALVFALGVVPSAWSCDLLIAGTDCCGSATAAPDSLSTSHGASTPTCHQSVPASKMTSADCCEMNVMSERALAERTRLQSLADGPLLSQMQSIALVMVDLDLRRQSSPDVHGPGLCTLLSTYLL